MSARRGTISLVAAFLGGWLTVPCALLVRFEYTGFGNDRDVGTRVPALVGYALLTSACLVVSMLLVRRLAPSLLQWAVGVYLVGIIAGVVMLGIFA